jgi:hypothetical protein
MNRKIHPHPAVLSHLCDHQFTYDHSEGPHVYFINPLKYQLMIHAHRPEQEQKKSAVKQVKLIERLMEERHQKMPPR